MGVNSEQIVADAQVAPEAVLDTTGAVEETQVTPQEEGEPQKPEGDKADKPEAEDVPFPKKAVNAISRRDKTIGKLRAQVQQYQAELAKYQQSQQSQAASPQKADPNAPKEDDFESYGEYLQAVMRYELDQRFANAKRQDQESKQSAEKETWYAEREAAVAQKAQEYASKIPDYQQVLAENADILDDMPAPIQEAFLHAEDAALAFYTLAKEGRLEALSAMQPIQAAQEIARAELRGASLTKPKQVTSAPQPMAGVKGTGRVTKSPDALQGDEFRAWLYNKK